MDSSLSNLKTNPKDQDFDKKHEKKHMMDKKKKKHDMVDNNVSENKCEDCGQNFQPCWDITPSSEMNLQEITLLEGVNKELLDYSMSIYILQYLIEQFPKGMEEPSLAFTGFFTEDDELLVKWKNTNCMPMFGNPFTKLRAMDPMKAITVIYDLKENIQNAGNLLCTKLGSLCTSCVEKPTVYSGPPLRWVTSDEIDDLIAEWHAQNDDDVESGTLCSRHYKELDGFGKINKILNDNPLISGGYFVLDYSIIDLCVTAA